MSIASGSQTSCVEVVPRNIHVYIYIYFHLCKYHTYIICIFQINIYLSIPTTVTQGPILSTSGMFQTSIEASLNSSRANEDDLQLPLWVRSAAKLLNGGSDGQDWLALAKRLG